MSLALPDGWGLIALDMVDSTNAEAMRQVRGGLAGPFWVWAQAQSSGRGRQGKPWISEPGNLYCTAVLTVDLRPQVWTQLSFVAGLAVYDAAALCLEQAAEPWQLALKWPNDLLLNGRKVSGILLESTVVPDADPALAIGIGLNVQHSPAEAPPPYRATHIAAVVSEIGVQTAFEFLTRTFAEWQRVWDSGAGFAGIRDAWTQRAHGMGQEVSVNLPDERLAGRFSALDEDGAMILELESGAVRRILVGDVFLAEEDHAAGEGAEG